MKILNCCGMEPHMHLDAAKPHDYFYMCNGCGKRSSLRATDLAARASWNCETVEQGTMLDMGRDGRLPMDRETFVATARNLLEEFKVENYEDDWIKIRTNWNGLDLEIRRCEMPREAAKAANLDHLSVDNPTTMVSKGVIIRHHGEHAYITAHMVKLLMAATRDRHEAI